MNEPTRTKDETTGREILVYPDGARKWGDTGFWLNGPTTAEHNPIIRDPRGMLALRNSKSKQVAREALDEGTNVDPSQWGTDEGFRRMIVHGVQVYMKGNSPRGLAELLKQLLVAAGYLSSKDEGDKIPPGHMTGTPAEILALIRLLDEDIKTEIAKAQAIEAEAK